jgi:hypothetical protein
MMKKSYRYRGFAIVVESVLLTTEAEALHPDVPPGYVAVIEIAVDHKPGFVTSTFEVGTSSGRLFQREAEVFASGYHAAISIIDKALGPSANAVRPGRVRASARLALLAA